VTPLEWSKATRIEIEGWDVGAGGRRETVRLLLRQCILEQLQLLMYSVSDSTRSGLGKRHHLQLIKLPPGAHGYKDCAASSRYRIQCNNACLI
jgi:hypothetical protein